MKGSFLESYDLVSVVTEPGPWDCDLHECPLGLLYPSGWDRMVRAAGAGHFPSPGQSDSDDTWQAGLMTLHWVQAWLRTRAWAVSEWFLSSFWQKAVGVLPRYLLWYTGLASGENSHCTGPPPNPHLDPLDPLVPRGLHLLRFTSHSPASSRRWSLTAPSSESCSSEQQLCIHVPLQSRLKSVSCLLLWVWHGLLDFSVCSAVYLFRWSGDFKLHTCITRTRSPSFSL